MQSDHDTHGCDYRWSRITPEYQDLMDTVKWQNVLAFASELHNGEVCSAEGPIGMGGRNFVRVLTFKGGERWLARFPLNQTGTDSLMLREADCLRIVAEQSDVPVPKVFAAVSQNPEFGTAFMLMECLPGNVGVDMDHDQIPQQHKSRFFKQMADAHVRKPSAHAAISSMLTHSVSGKNIEYLVPTHRDTFQTKRWNYQRWTNTWHRGSI